MPLVDNHHLTDWSAQSGQSAYVAEFCQNLDMLAYTMEHRGVRYSLTTPNALLFVSDSALWVLAHLQGRMYPGMLVQHVDHVGIGGFVEESFSLGTFTLVEEFWEDALGAARWVIVVAREITDTGYETTDDTVIIPARRDFVGYLTEMNRPDLSGWIRWTVPNRFASHRDGLPVAGDVARPQINTYGPARDIRYERSSIRTILET